ncbi:Superoxide dismutase [Mn/Fe] [bioreactor metagenome]|jgi:superoxide dismutase, Fe-Mn family|uniref:Superoxide dismutase n=3 Tax=root TaxID=1 RepID=A0A069CZ59_9BACE|nr:superoxide dismutase [Bacteroides graminisolvens]MDD3210247.1 superoxide dismutase [Bacteroides graminisolvens]MDD4417705.1 superoxide dismutase [Bacteroides graminisolvens]MEA4887637.1 superoxide dismutase [Bacteroides graminisolvens]GAK35415.1 superoxide dismutase [Bacteroides graminisolvens DSM 19988 = JCM 15093]HAZ58194.1 superoxide dismutase [Bacteroides graminisolvens]
MNTLLMSLIFMTMTYNMPTLPYATNALEPVISQQTIEFHYGKHLQAYVNNLNSLVPGTEFEGKSVEEIVKTAPDGAVFNNAGQVLNHELYFTQFAPKPAHSEPVGKLAEAIVKDFGSFDNFKKEFTAASVGLFGSGWAWLSVDKSGKLVITKEANGSNPVRAGLKPLLGFDVWEHSYYLDYQNRRADHINALWSIVDWDVVGSRF